MKVAIDTSKKKAELEDQAKALRDAAEIENIEWPAGSGVMWQVRDKDVARMQKTLDAAKTLSAPPEMTVNWILADNSERVTTASDLEQVLLANTLRMQSIFQQYTVWRASGMRSPFIIE